MKKRLLVIAACALIAVQCFLLAGCGAEKVFGEFCVDGKYLKEYAVKGISFDELKDLIGKYERANNTVRNAENDEAGESVDASELPVRPETSDALVNEIITTFGSVNINCKYFADEAWQDKNYTLMGSDYNNMLKKNEYSPFNQLTAKNLVLSQEIIEYMEAENALFDMTSAPYDKVYSYHVDKNNNVIIQQHNFVEIPSSVYGGVGCSFRQDIEAIYDAAGKITKWQTSLGIYSSMPDGTSKQGYTFEMDFDWILKG